MADGTMAFHVENPDGFLYRGGQFADWTLIDPPQTDVEGNTRGFSLASAPYEEDLRIATRLRDTAFKRVLKDLPDGTPLKLDAPYGSLTLGTKTAIPAIFLTVFLTGGIDITPVRSIVLAKGNVLWRTTHNQCRLSASTKRQSWAMGCVC